MCQNSMSDNFDYSQLTANTGIQTISSANSNLDGTGEMEQVLVAGGSGTIIKSITIKSVPEDSSLYWSLQGMVRLFIQNADASITTLYKEIPIPAVPVMNPVSLPTPIFSSFETVITGDLKLKAGYSLFASTQVANTFNIIAEGLDYAYPGTPPTECCTLVKEVANTGINSISTGTGYSYDGTDAVNIFKADASTKGAVIKAITIKAQGSTHEGMVRLYISTDGSNYTLMRKYTYPKQNSRLM